jgi:hypothetical protein
MLKLSSSWYFMSRTCGPRDVISLVIPRLGDNKSEKGLNKTLGGILLLSNLNETEKNK